MYLKIDNYTDFTLKIKKAYEDDEDFDDKWCNVTLTIKNEYFNYDTFNNEILLESEIKFLIKELYKLVKGKLRKRETIDFMEPDLEFELMPSKDIYGSITNIRINLFYDGVLSADYYNLCLNIEETKKIMLYLNTVIPTIDFKDMKYEDTKDDNYCYVTIKYDDYEGDKTYAYILTKDISQTNVGDKVLVDRAGNTVIGSVVSKNFYDECNVPYPIRLTKEVIKTLKNPEDYEEYYFGKNKKFKCPCCGYYTLNEVNKYEVCPVCNWEDDPIQRKNPNDDEGTNKISLNLAKENYNKYYAVKKEFVRKVRYPELNETIYYGKYNSIDDICDVLYFGTIEEIKYVIKGLEIEYSFGKETAGFSIKIKKLGVTIKGKGRKNPDYNCIKYLGDKFSYKEIINKELIKICPKCNKELVEIVYGFPLGDVFEKAERKEIYFGGCCKTIGEKQPRYHCYNCNRNYYRDLTSCENSNGNDLNCSVKNNSQKEKMIIGYYGQSFFGGGTYIKLSTDKNKSDKYKIEYLHSAVPNYIENAEKYISKYETIDIDSSCFYKDYKNKLTEKEIDENVHIIKLEEFINSINLKKMSKKEYNDEDVFDGLCWYFYIMENDKAYNINGYEKMPEKLKNIVKYLEKIARN